MTFPVRVLVGLLAMMVAATGVEAATTTRKKTPPAPPPSQDQSYLFLTPSSARPSGPPGYVTQGTGLRDQPFFNSISDPGSTPIWSNR